jgi:hypothetical protein
MAVLRKFFRSLLVILIYFFPPNPDDRSENTECRITLILTLSRSVPDNLFWRNL